MINTYGVFGKVEFVMGVKIGNQEVVMDFNGGSLSTRGIIPATYTTNNPLVQRALEFTPEYRSGIVRKINSVEEPNDVVVARMKRAMQGEEVKDEPQPSEETATAEANPVTEVKVSCIDDAVEYLKSHYEGYSSTRLRTKAAVVKAGEEHGIVFVGL